MSKQLIFYLITVNLVTFVFYGIDKYKAIHHRWRISEFFLLLMTFIGGSLGAVSGMSLFHHKTRHLKFKILVPLFFILHVMFIVVYISTTVI